MTEQERKAYDEWIAKGMPAGRIPGLPHAFMTDEYDPVPICNDAGIVVEVKMARRIESFPFISLFGPKPGATKGAT